MPDDVGGRPFPDGWEPDDERGGADDPFASVVLDEDFVRAAEIHEPTAVERLLAAAQARADAEAARSGGLGPAGDEEPYDDEYGRGGRREYDWALHEADDPDDEDGPYGPHGGALRPYRPSSRWHRPVAWIVALVMGVGMVALAFAAVYRGGTASGGQDGRTPSPATTNTGRPGAEADTPRVAAVPHPG
ncbi:hypothetical protein NX801_21205 [Streptomyces sp. LP05-1]|uniref:Uncharacterized protein n=1 Tax=Streptomyces pyxinae TaxID=2970734 RepID=A0ABT2CL33_9ACTN|nr:hypothetical protein [Streptomyces sp. LP05-1]MCS0638126.1 hypothetical protein [Streptomyces sp. LP05-1]